MIIPALDLINGNIVRLHQGNYGKKREYGNQPQIRIHNYQIHGANFLHMVDLTGAKNPAQRQIYFLYKLLYSITIPVQVGGGIRNAKNIEELLKIGSTRVVVGSTAVKKIFLLQGCFEHYGAEAIVLALDVRRDEKGRNRIAMSGWQENSKATIEQKMEQFIPYGLKHVLCTDILRDGTMIGSNITFYKKISKCFPNLAFQASGGIGKLEDIIALRGIGLKGLIIGRALLDGQFNMKEAIECWQNGSSLV